jgi:dihydrofolate reductase
MKLTTITQITLDGVTQGNGGSTEEDLRNGFDRGGWARGAGDDSTRDRIAATFERADAFLFGRRTYDVLFHFWGTMEELKRHPIGVALNAKPKYATSGTLTEPKWENSSILSGDLLASITALKAEGDGGLQVHGSSRLIQRFSPAGRPHYATL